MNFTKFFILIFIMIYHGLMAQNDSIANTLDEVVVLGKRRVLINSISNKLITLPDSVIANNKGSFTNLLRFNSPIYFVEYGIGGTSSPRFRGTGSSNVAVVWHGININSVNNGQTDFNGLNASLFDVIDVRTGGGNIEYGSGAIAGTIHLHDDLSFKKSKPIYNIQSLFGSFNTWNNVFKVNASDTNFSFNSGISYVKSENDFPWQGYDLKNENGAYNNLGFNINAAYKFNEKSKLELYTNHYKGERFFSGVLPNPKAANTKYQDFYNRFLLNYKYKTSTVSQEFKMSYLEDEYRYFDNILVDDFTFGKSNRYIIDYTIDMPFKQWNAILTTNSNYELTLGKTDIIDEKREQFYQSISYKQQLNSKTFFDVKLRKDYNSVFNVPLSFAYGFKTYLSSLFFLRANTSKNYRVPTFNDLFWPGQGNPNLNPEEAIAGEIGMGVTHKLIQAELTYFSIFVDDKIVWTPNGDSKRPGVWTPVNLEKSKHQGLEMTLNIQKEIQKSQVFNLKANYSYTIAKNEETNTYLIFVPKHLLNINATYSYKKCHLLYQFLYNDEVFTTESNSLNYIIPEFNVHNIGLNYDVIKKTKSELTFGIKVNNTFNQAYMITVGRPMPGRNFNININYKFN